MGIINRNNEEVRVILHGLHGETREISNVNEIYFYVHSLTHSIGPIFFGSLANLDIYRIFVLGNAVAKSAMHKNNDKEKSILFEGKDRITAQYCEVIFKGRKLVFTYDLSAVYALFIRNEYDISKRNIKGKVVVDAGANIGIFSLMAAALGAKKVYAFEPVKETYELLKQNVKLNELENVIVPVNKALGNQNSSAEISYRGVGDVGASIELNRGAMKTQKIEIVSLDDFLKNEDVGFIKMDVEGYEEKALLGARETIKRCKPVLAFSAYHKPDDKKRLPEVVRSIRDDYKFTLNKFSDENFYCE